LSIRPFERHPYPSPPAKLAGNARTAEPMLRTLDAIHVAAALYLGPVEAFVTYDERQAAVARLEGLRTVAPGAR
jgi:predicted nucleic acid-binding protein